MEAIVLAGGFGTRLAHIVSDVPKPMAPVCGQPFLYYVLNDLAHKGVARVILAVGYKAECIEGFFGASYMGMQLVYSLEDKPLFTGGAIKKALSKCTEENVLVLNGDTFFDVDLALMQKIHIAQNAALTIATKHMQGFERYGTVQSNNERRISAFAEKAYCSEGEINGGVYFLNCSALSCIAEEKFSFETDFMQKYVKEMLFFAFKSEGYFIDIGIPEDYAQAQEDFKAYE